MRRIVSQFFLFFLMSDLINAQEIPEIKSNSAFSNMATPNVANMERFTESQLNYYSGTASTSIPIFTIKAGSINYPISLNYASGGIQVNSIASDVGLGWSITDTFVNRTVVGDADLETLSNPYKTNEDCEQNENFSYTNFKNGYFQNLIEGPTNYSKTTVDYFPDIFNFNSSSKGFKFFFPNINIVREFDKNGNKIEWNLITKKYDYLSQRNPFNSNQINPVNSKQCVTDYDNFTITTNNGIKYYFNEKDINHSYSQNGSAYDALGSIAGTFPRVSSWHVSRITDNATEQDINFLYEDYTTERTNLIDDLISNHHYFDSSGKNPDLIGTDEACFLSPGETTGAYYFNRGLNIKRLKKIIFPTGTIEFNYNLERNDLPNGKALTSIVIKDVNGKEINEFELKYDYFYSSIQKNEYSKRLKLISVQEIGVNVPLEKRKPKFQFEYYEDMQMPNVGSPFQDFFGYCNQVESNQTDFSSKYYYYPGKREFSILPYEINTDNNHYLLKGSINKEPNDSSKTWSLKKIIFPTGGSNIFDLESNTFELLGSTVKGAGVRVKKQILQESLNSAPRTFDYFYTNNGMTSGFLFNIPYVGHPAVILYDFTKEPYNLSRFDTQNLQKYFFLYNSSRINFDIINNFFIGYSKIEQNENGIKTVYEYYNEEYPNTQTRSNQSRQGTTLFPNHCMSGFIVTNSALGNEAYIDKSRFRGKIKSKLYYTKNAINPIKKEEYFYKSFLEDDYIPNYENELYVNGAIVTPVSNTSGDNNNSFAELVSQRKSYNSTYNNLAYVKTTNFLVSGNVIEEKRYDYDTSNQNLIGEYLKVDKGLVFPIYKSTIYDYPSSLTTNSTPYANELRNINKVNSPLEITKLVGEVDHSDFSFLTSEVLEKKKVVYSKDSKTSNKILPIEFFSSLTENNLYSTGTIDRYDNKGNLLQFTSNGLSTTLIYGYNQSYPIAKIEGATYEDIMKAFGKSQNDNQSYLQLEIVEKSNLDKDLASEQTLIAALDAFRTKSELSNYQITTYTYDPLIGATSITPPSGIREIYKYDSANRLESVKDINGNILKENKYNYKH